MHDDRVHHRTCKKGATMSPIIEALLIERAGYVRRNLPSRVAAVDAALRELDFDHKYMTAAVETATAEPQTERTTEAKTRRRRTE